MDCSGVLVPFNLCVALITQVQTGGLHFFNNAPAPSGQQYTGISVAQAAISLIPEAEINNATNIDTTVRQPTYGPFVAR